jgi:hypothetical protein
MHAGRGRPVSSSAASSSLVLALAVYIAFVWVLNDLALSIQDKCFFVPGNVAVQFFSSLSSGCPLQICRFRWLVNDLHLDLSMRGHLGYEAMCSTMSDWIFPGILTDAAGLSSAAGLVATCPVIGAWQRRRSVLLHCHPGARCKDAVSSGSWATCTWTGPCGATWATRRCAPPCPTGSSQVCGPELRRGPRRHIPGFRCLAASPFSSSSLSSRCLLQ